MKSIFSAILFLLASSFAVTAQANVDFGFEGFTANLNDDGDPDGSYANPDGLYPAYGGAGTGLVSVVQEDGVNSSAMLRFENGPGADWWSGFTLAAEYSGTDFIGDGSVPVTMTVLADQDGTVRLRLEAAGQTPFTQSLAVTSGWNSLSFDLNGVDASINWQAVQIRPDAEGETNNGELARIYYFDDVAFPSATIVQAPAPSNPVTAGFLAGAVTPTVAASDVFSLYSDAYDTADSNSILNGYGITDWSVPGNSQTEMTIDNANEIKRFGDAEFVGYDFPSFAIAGYENLSLSLYRQDTSDFLIKLVDTQVTDENGDPAPNATAQYTIPADQMVAGQWTTINIPMTNFAPSVTKINQIVIEPLLGGIDGATETFYLDDMYFHGSAMVTASVSLEAQSDDAYVYVNSDIWGWSDSVWTEGAAELADGVWTWTYEILAGSSFEYKWVVYAADNTGGPEDLTLLEDGTCAPANITSDYNARVYVEGADTNIFGECITVDTDGDGIPNANDTDDDNDGVVDEQDSFPLDANFSSNEFTDAYFEEAFSGATITLADDGSNVYTFPSTDAAAWAGFANQHIAVYPIRLTGAGSITFDASVPTGEDVNVRFRFEKLPFPATEPSFNTDHVTVSGDVESSYTINLPAQGANTFESLIMYIGADCGAANAAADCADEFAADRDVGVVIKNVTVNSDIDDPSTPDINEGSGGNGVAIPGTITFSVDMTGQDTTSDTPRVIGDWNSYCGGACGEMTESDVAGVWTLDIPLQPSNGGSTYVFALGDTQETLLYDDGSEIACSNQSPYGEVAEDDSQAYNLNRILEVVNGDAVLPTIPFNDCDSDADGVADSADAFPNDASETADTDGDGVGDNSDYAPNDPNVTVDSGVSVPATPTGGVVMTFEDTSVALNPGYGGVAASYASILEVDGVTTRNMLKLVNNANSAWWSGVALALEFADSDFRGDGSAQVTMRVYAEQDGDLMLQIESGASQFDDKKSVVTGWNNVTFDLSGADTALNWNNVQIRPDALSGVNNVAETVYYIDDVHFADATIVQEPEPTVIIALPVDFEEASDAYEIGGFDGGVASVEAGPDGAVSLKYIKGAGQNWAGVFINLNTAVDAANGEVMTADVYSTEARDITLKFDAANVERVASHTGSGWEALSYDFTGAMPAGQTKIAFFNDLTQQGDGTDAWTIYIDNLAQASAPAPVDSDGDGVADDADAFPNDATETADTDSDGTGDNADAFPNDASETVDTDGDGVGDNSDYAPNDPSVTVAPTVPATPTGGVVMTFEDTSVALNPGYGGVAASYASMLEVDGVTSRNMLKLVNGAGSQWWSGVALALEFAGSDFRGDGSALVTMRVYAEQDGDLMLQIESGATQFDDKKSVVTGWNNVTFDLSGADTALNWNNVQIRPDALSVENNVAETVYYIDDVHFADATIVVPTVTIELPVDFEEAADAYQVGGFDGGAATVEAGPDGANSLKYVKGAGANWAGVFINLNTAVDSANGEIVTADVHSTVARDITLKFDVANVERLVSHGGTGWESLSFDFTGAMPASQTKIAFFNDLTQQGDGTDAWTIYIDNLAQTSAPAPVDSDGDGVADDADAFPNDATETVDADNDGVGDNADAFPNDGSETVDSDNDGVGDNSDYAPNDPNVTVAPSVPATPTGGVVMTFEDTSVALNPGYGGVAASYASMLEVDGVTSRNMLKLVNGAGSQWWSGVALALEFAGSDFRGDGSALVTMRVYAEQDGDLMLQIESGATQFDDKKSVVTGWNNVTFDLSGADTALNWNNVQIRPDALSVENNVAETVYYIDDVHFADATIVVPTVTIELPVDFEEAADAYQVGGFDGGAATVEAGPDGANSLKYVKGAGANWAGVFINLNTAVDSANGEIVTADVHSTVARDITLKFDVANVERLVSHGGTGWESLSFDFTGAMPASQTKIAFFNDLTQQGDGTDAWTIYIDNLAQTSAPAPVDSDGDGVADDADAFPNDATETVDADNDGVGDNADAFPNDGSETVDSDNDGVGDNADAFPNDGSETVDADNDGVGDNADAFPNDGSETVDTDNDGVGDNSDYAPNDPNVTVAPSVPATPTGGVVMTFEDTSVALNPGYGGVAASYASMLEVDGVTSRNMLKLVNGAGSQWWSGVALALEFAGSDFRGDGSALVTMRVYAEQDGDLMLQIESGATQFDDKKSVVTGWNNVTFDLSGADTALNWNNVQIRPDALSVENNVAETVYYIDDVHFADATIVVPTVTIELPVDFEEAADAYQVGGFDGGAATVEAGPDGANSLKYVKGAGANWAGVFINLNTAVDSANGEIVTADVHSTVARDITLKFDVANVERLVSHGGTGWESLSFDFTGAMPASQTKIAFFNDLTQQGDGTDAWTIYIDNLAQTSAPAPVDSDGDGVADDADAFPNDATETVDADNDGVGDNADAFPNDGSETVDSDNDGVGDNADAFPNDGSETVDADNDGVGDNADAFPNDGSETVDTDNDGVGDNSDYAPNDPNVTVAPSVPATPTGGVVMTFEDTSVALNPGYGGVAASYASMLEVDGVTSRNMLKLVNGAGSQWWSGVALALEFAGSDFRGDGSALVTMRVYAEQDGDLMLQIESGATQFDDKKSVVTGWNNVTFDLSGADTALNWNNVQIRPDALSVENNVAETVYYIDDVHFADATIVVPTVTIELPVDFEEAADAYQVGGFDGGAATVEAGPDGANSLKYVKGAGANWAGVFINLNTAVDSANGEIVTADVHSTVARDITLKFDVANVERLVSHGGTGWESLSFDFTGAMPASQTKIAFFNDLTQQGDGTDAWTIYIDNLAQTSAPAPVDSDGDGVADDADAFPNDATETVDADNDGVGDNADAFPNDGSETVDSDNDGVGDNADAFPNDGSETVDADNDGVGDNADAFPNDGSETVDTDNDGVGDNSDYAPNDPNVQNAPALPEQQVSVVSSPMGVVGSDIEVTVGYDASNDVATATGIGMRMHYDSSILTFVSLSDVLGLDNITTAGPINDAEDFDSDPSTDKYVIGAWAAFGGAWAVTLPTELLTVTFTVNDVDSASTEINFSSSSTSVGYEFAPTSYSLDIIEGSFDFDGNGTHDALSDGLLFLRYAFDFTGSDVTDGVVANDSPMTNAEILASLETAKGSFGDIDGNGVVDALTDGILLIRSLFGFSGDALISGAVGDSTTTGAVGDATRTTAAEIQTYIDSMSL